MRSNRFLSTPALAGLKDFQRRTVDYVFKRLYGDDPTSRFLIADEVGLKKRLSPGESSPRPWSTFRTRWIGSM